MEHLKKTQAKFSPITILIIEKFPRSSRNRRKKQKKLLVMLLPPHIKTQLASVRNTYFEKPAAKKPNPEELAQGKSFDQIQQIWHDTYYDPKTGYVSAERLWHKLPEEARKGVSYFGTFLHWYNSQRANQITRIPRKDKHAKFNSFTAAYPVEKIQMDIMVYNRFLPLTGPRYPYILNVIDVYSRYASARPLMNRELDHVFKAFQSILKEWNKGNPKVINCDQEFGKGTFKKWFVQNNVRVILSFRNEKNKNPIVERFNGTLANKLQKWRIATGRTDWPAVLDDIIFNYNNTFHSTIKATPKQVFDGQVSTGQVGVVLPSSFQQGDLVKVLADRKVFAKGDEPYYLDNVYQITGRQGQRYHLTDLKTGQPFKRRYGGPVKSYEIQSISQLENYRPPQDSTPFETIDPATSLKKAQETRAIIQRVKREAKNISSLSSRKRVRQDEMIDIDKEGKVSIVQQLPMHEKRQSKPVQRYGYDGDQEKKKRKKG